MRKFGIMIRKLRIDRGHTQQSLADAVGVTKQAISNYENDTRIPDYDVLEAIADVLNVPMEFFLTKEEQSSELTKEYAKYINVHNAKNIMPVERKRVRLYGNIAAGAPIAAHAEYETYVESDSDTPCDYALIVDGDSMEPTIMRGDIVFIRAQDDVDDGQIAAVLIDDSATLKRIYHIKNGLQLASDNIAKYPPRTVTMPEFDTIKILGKAVAFKRKL